MKHFFCFLLLLCLISACISETENPTEMNLSIILFGSPQCIGLKSAATTVQTPASQSCIEFAFDQDNRKLNLKHINAGFNCCPESLWCTVIYRNDTIIVQEFEKHAGCKCNCLYDLDIELKGVEPGKYQLRLIEPYCGSQTPLVGLLDLRAQKQGSFCISRNIYPWGNQ